MPRLEMTIKWTVETPLNIAGAPADNPLVDTPLLREYRANNRDSRILLSASTIKGKLRGEAERLLRTFKAGNELCEGRRPERMCPAFWWDKNSSPQDGLCLVCRLFGSPWQPSNLVFSDVTAQNVRTDDTVVRPGIGLSRVRGTVQEDLLFFVETTPALTEGVNFANCEVKGEVIEEPLAALLWTAAQQVAAFGNGRSRGRGWLQSRDVQLRVDKEEWDEQKVAQALSNWLGIALEEGVHRG
jgi:CRISPR/Cas system CSM-associated protein Csm3 (group 7 of RAMP superfamily)